MFEIELQNTKDIWQYQEYHFLEKNKYKNLYGATFLPFYWIESAWMWFKKLMISALVSTIGWAGRLSPCERPWSRQISPVGKKDLQQLKI